jgi:hypothetical protein
MFCPGCGQPPASERVRYCTHCGFALNQLTEWLARAPQTATPRQFDITLGAGLMLVGVLKSVLLVLSLGGSSQEALWQALFPVAFGFGLLQLLFHLSPRQKGLSLGATLLFLAALMAGPATALYGSFGAALIAAGAIPLILFWSKLAQAFVKLFFARPEPVRNERPPSAPPALATAEASNAVEFDTQRVKQKEPVPAPSVTEQTTGLLR